MRKRLLLRIVNARNSITYKKSVVNNNFYILYRILLRIYISIIFKFFYILIIKNHNNNQMKYRLDYVRQIYSFFY